MADPAHPFDFSSIVSGILQPAAKIASGVPQTQQDVNVIAGAVQQVQTPQFQADLGEAKQAVIAYAGAQLFFQFVSTAAMVGMFLIQLKASRRRE